jgi:hypothetical protein
MVSSDITPCNYRSSITVGGLGLVRPVLHARGTVAQTKRDEDEGRTHPWIPVVDQGMWRDPLTVVACRDMLLLLLQLAASVVVCLRVLHLVSGPVQPLDGPCSHRPPPAAARPVGLWPGSFL